MQEQAMAPGQGGGEELAAKLGEQMVNVLNMVGQLAEVVAKTGNEAGAQKLAQAAQLIQGAMEGGGQMPAAEAQGMQSSEVAGTGAQPVR